MKIDYTKELLCTHCGVKHLIIHCRFIVGFGYQCPDCKKKCRTKVKYNAQRRKLIHPYIRVNKREFIADDIQEIKARLE